MCVLLGNQREKATATKYVFNCLLKFYEKTNKRTGKKAKNSTRTQGASSNHYGILLKKTPYFHKTLDRLCISFEMQVTIFTKSDSSSRESASQNKNHFFQSPPLFSKYNTKQWSTVVC